MALGDTYNNNEKKNYSPSVNAGYRFGNPDSNIDKTSLSFTYWNKLLKVSIAPKKDDPENPDNIAYDHDIAGSIYLSHTKAFVLYKEIIAFLEDYTKGKAVTNAGVASGKDGLVYICDGKEFNAEGPCFVIRKINNETGKCEGVYVYEFRRGIHSSVINYVEKNSSFDSKFYDFIEIEQVANLLKSYYESMTMAVAYSVVETQKYDTSRINTKLKVIAEKLGADFKAPSVNTASRASNNSYFSNARSSSSGNYGYSGGNTSYESGSLDDLD